MGSARRVTVVSHGPNCLDGLTCAVVAARYFAGRRFEPTFASNNEIDASLQAYAPTEPGDEELWITDISWRDGATDLHLTSLVEGGLELYWIDHHKTAIERRKAGGFQIPFTDVVLDDRFAASRLLFNYLKDRAAKRGESRPGLLATENLVLLADDVDRWILSDPRSRELGLAVRAMSQDQAYRALLAMDSNITYTREIREALQRVQQELQRTLTLALSTRHVEEMPQRGLVVVAAECDGYAGEIADRWSKDFRNAVFVLYDHRGNAISLRRTPDCRVDLSRLAAVFGGGGHPAAAGCQIDVGKEKRAQRIGRKVCEALSEERDR